MKKKIKNLWIEIKFWIEWTGIPYTIIGIMLIGFFTAVIYGLRVISNLING